MNLYELTEAQLWIARQLEETEGEIEPGSELDELITSGIIESLEDDTHDKLDGYAGLIKSWKAQDQLLCDEIQRLQVKRRIITNATQRLREGLAQYFEKTGQSGLKTTRFSFSYGKQGQRPVEILCPFEELPLQYREYEPKVDKKSLRDDMDSDGEVTNIVGEVIARLGEQKTGVTIR